MANWLYDWKHRIKITLDSSKFDAAVTWFPCLLAPVAGLVGQGDTDISRVFEHLLDNKLKIAVTKSDGQTQLYVEVVSWDWANKNAELWFSKTGWSISDSVDTVIYLYYDISQPDNTTYVGVPGSAPGESVWDSNFVLVDHLNDNPDTSHTMDSTGNDNDGTKKGANEPIEDGGEQSFDGVDDYITYGNDASLNPVNAITVETLYKNNNAQAGNVEYPVAKNLSYHIGYDHPQDAFKGHFAILDATATWRTSGDSPISISTGVYHYHAGTFTGDYIRVYLDGAFQSEKAITTTIYIIANPLVVGAKDAASEFFDGNEDEVRISNIARTAAWLNATYYTLWDDVISAVEFEDYLTEPASGQIAVRCQQFGQVLTKDIITAYSKALGDSYKTSDILTDLLAYQEVERVTLGSVSPSLDKVIAVNLAMTSVWEACKIVRDTVGGYLHVDIDTANPLLRKLWLTSTLGENKGQQIRLGKNLTGIAHTLDYIDYCNRLYPVGDSGLLLSTKTYADIDCVPSEDASYGYLTLAEQYGAYLGWTGVGDALPGNITVKKPTGAWVAFTGDSLGSGWTDQTTFYQYVIGGNSWTSWLTFTHAGQAATQVRFPNVWTRQYPLGPWLPMWIVVEIQYGAAWHEIYNASSYLVAEGDPIIVTFAQQTLTGMRIKYYNDGSPGYWTVNVYKAVIRMWNPTGLTDDTANWVQGADEQTVRCAIGVYVSGTGYLISYTHAPYLIALDGVSSRSDIYSKSLSLDAASVDILLNKGRVKLAELLEPIVRLDTSLIDLSVEEGRDFERLQPGSTVRVIDEGLGVNYETQIVRLAKPDLHRPEKIIIELANKVPDIIDTL